VADAVTAAPLLELAGVEGFEGTLPAADVEPYLARLRELVETLFARGAFTPSVLWKEARVFEAAHACSARRRAY